MVWGLGAIAGSIALEGARATFGYATDVAGKAYGMKLISNTVQNGATIGKYVGSYVGLSGAGAVVGETLGKAAAGNFIETAAQQAGSVTNALNTVGATLGTIGSNLVNNQKAAKKITPLTAEEKNTAKAVTDLQATADKVEGNAEDQAENTEANAAKSEVDTAENSESAKAVENVEWIKTATNVAIIASAVGTLAIGGGIFLPVAAAMVANGPKIAEAMTSEKPNTSFSSDLQSATIDVGIAALANMAGGLAAYNVVQNAYDQRLGLCQRIGSGIGSYMPECVGNIFTTAGNVVGMAEGTRVALDPTTIAKAVEMRTNTQVAVQAGLDLTNAVVQKQTTNATAEGSTWYDTAKAGATITTAAVAAGCLVYTAPVVAPITLGAAAIKMLPSGIEYARAKLFTEAKEEAPIAGPEQTIEELETEFLTLEFAEENGSDFVFLGEEPAPVPAQLTCSKIITSVDLSKVLQSVIEDYERSGEENPLMASLSVSHLVSTAA